MDFIKRAEELHEELVEYRRTFHRNPELGLDLPDTTAFVMKKLTEFGYEPKEISKSGVVACAGGKKPGKVFLIRGDMDALPITEEADCEFASTNGRMHACGHDFHTTMMLGAAKLLKECEDEIDGTVKLMFQPGEETLSGAKDMVANGLLENPKVDAGMMIHVLTGFPLPTGTVIIPEAGPMSASSDLFEIEIQGKGGHGAMPESTVDPLNVVAHTHIALQAIPARETAAADPVVVTVGHMQGGQTHNVIPDTAIMKGTIRTFDADTRVKVCKRVAEIAEGVAATFGATVDAKVVNGCPSVSNDAEVLETVSNALIKEFGARNAIKIADVMPGGGKMMGSEDFSFVSTEIPSIMLSLSAGSAKDGYIYPMHHPMAIFDEACLPKGAATYAIAATSWLSKHK